MNKTKDEQRLIVIIEGPSGVGKDSIMQGLIKKYPATYEKLASITTRAMREGESQGNPYFFVDEAKFKEMLASGQICEYTMRHGTYRGISLPLIDEILDKGIIPLKDSDKVGIAALKKAYPGKVLTIFVKAQKHEIEARLRNRGDSEQDLRVRLGDYENYMKCEPEFDYSIENKVLEDTTNKIHEIIQKEKSKRKAKK